MRRGIISLGEALIDFIPTDGKNEIYHKSPGGAPANVAVGVAKLGARATFLGKVGNDSLGRFLENTLNFYDVNTEQLKFSDDLKTGITIVTNEADGERNFEFFINPSADRFLKTSDIDEEGLIKHKILHVGSISLISSPAKEATKYAIRVARENDMIISYDPNVRLDLWESEEEARQTILSIMQDVSFLKVSEEELIFLTLEQDINKGVDKLRKYNIPLIIVSLGSNGSMIYTKDGHKHVPTIKVKAVDTTGAGDAFVAGILSRLNEFQGDLNEISIDEAIDIVTFASIVGALTTTKKGAMNAIPTVEEVKRVLKGTK